MKRIPLKTTLSVVLVLSSIAIQAQDSDTPTKDLYLSYFGNDSTNINIIYAPCNWYDYYALICGVIYNSDTIRINGELYFYRVPQSLDLINQPAYHYLFPRQDTLFLREERETGRLYRYYRDYFGMGETEKLICDMTLDVGDKFTTPAKDCFDDIELEVTHVDYDNGIKTIRLNGYYEQIFFIEGIFPSSFPLWQEPVEYGLPASFEYLLCVHKDGVQVYGGANECWPDFLDMDETTVNPISIFPNVITNNDVITIEASAFIKNVIITDILGRAKGINKNIIDGNKWQISFCDNIEKGMYFVFVLTDNGISYEKVILSD